MGRCCICGNNTDANSGGLLINGRTAPICNECGEILDAAETLEQQNPQKIELHSLLNGKMKENGAPIPVIEAVNEFFTGEETDDINAFIASERNEHEREKREAAAARSDNQIEGLCSFLAVFAVIFLVAGVILSLVIGIPLTKDSYTRAGGWSVIIGGMLGTVLSFAMILLVLSVASAIGKINDKMNVTNEKIDRTNQQLSGIAGMLPSFDSRRQKKQQGGTQ